MVTVTQDQNWPGGELAPRSDKKQSLRNIQKLICWYQPPLEPPLFLLAWDAEVAWVNLGHCMFGMWQVQLLDGASYVYTKIYFKTANFVAIPLVMVVPLLVSSEHQR